MVLVVLDMMVVALIVVVAKAAIVGMMVVVDMAVVVLVVWRQSPPLQHLRQLKNLHPSRNMRDGQYEPLVLLR